MVARLRLWTGIGAGLGLALTRRRPVYCTPAVIRPRPVVYRSPLEKQHNYIWESVLTTRRFIYLLLLFVPVVLTSPLVLVQRRWGAVWWYGFLVSRMEAAGPTFIKLAQWAASRADLFPSDLCLRLGALHSRGRVHPLDHTKAVIQTIFRRPFHQVFQHFDEIPIGSGAIAQVYRATLNPDLIPPAYLGPRRTRSAPAVILHDPLPSVPTASVAIKVLHPNVQSTISRDLRIMAFFASAINLFPAMQWLSLPEEVEAFGRMMHQQLDLRHEADNLLTFERNFAPRNLPLSFPRPLNVWSSKHLLVEEYMNALPLEPFLRNGGGPFDEQIATIGLDAFLNMLLLDNFVHSDLHPGNIMIKFSKPPSTRILLENIYNHLFHPNRPQVPPADYSDSDSIVTRLRSLVPSPSEWHAELESLHSQGYVPEIVFIDAGLVTTLDETNRKNFLDLFRAVAEFDGYRTGELMVERSRSPQLALDTHTFALKMQHLVLSVKRKTFSLGQIKISDLLTEVLKHVRHHHVKMEGDFINTVISILLLEGIGRQLDPGLDLFASSLPILRTLGGQMAKSEAVTPRDLPKSNLGAFLKVWVWMEARSFISSAIINADDLVKYDLLCPSV